MFQLISLMSQDPMKALRIGTVQYIRAVPHSLRTIFMAYVHFFFK